MMTYFFKNSCIGFHQGSKHENTVESTRPQAECFYCFTVLEELLNHAPGIKENGKIDEFFTRRQVCCYEKLYCYGDLHFEKGCEPCYHVLGNLNK